jgi:hypothetical protein
MAAPEYFVKPGSIVRQIWGRSDTILFIFAGASAEFALNKAVDWLYFTGKLPADPLNRLFSTVSYARLIVFSEMNTAHNVIDKMRAIHNAVEDARKATIPDWAYRDVLYMLIHYSIASFELLTRKLTWEEKEEVFDVFYRVGARMGLQALPARYQDWLVSRQEHLSADLVKSTFTTDLFLQYKKHLGLFRYKVLLEAQKLVVPQQVSKLLSFGPVSFFSPMISLYKWSRKMKIDWFVISVILPGQYKKQIKDLNIQPRVRPS